MTKNNDNDKKILLLLIGFIFIQTSQAQKYIKLTASGRYVINDTSVSVLSVNMSSLGGYGIGTTNFT